MKFGILGYGNIARKFVKSIEAVSGSSVYAVASHSVERSDPYLSEHPEVVIYRDYEELLADPQVEGVYIALPHLFHKEWILKSIAQGRPVLCEKPMVLTPEDVDEIREAAIKNGVYCMEAMKTKFSDGWDGLQKDLAEIGTIQKIDANFCYEDHRQNRAGAYLYDSRQGGAVNDVGSYPVAFVLGIAKSAVNEMRSMVKYKNGIDTWFQAELLFENGITGIAEGAIDRKKEREAHIYGTLGMIKIPYFNRITEYDICLKDGTVLHRDFPVKGDDMSMEIRCFVEEAEGKKAECSRHPFRDVRAVSEVCGKVRELCPPDMEV